MLPKLLLHTCCAPCSVGIIEHLKSRFELTLFFADNNIWPLIEFEKRAGELIKLVEKNDLNLTVIDYDHHSWQQEVASGLESEPEGGQRCQRCWRWRLEKVAQLAREKKITKIATTLSVSPHKEATFVNQVLKEVADKYHLNPLLEDFSSLFSRSCELSRQHNFYRQKYCGCEFSAARLKNNSL